MVSVPGSTLSKNAPAPAIYVIIESPLWQAVPEAADTVRRAIAQAAGPDAGKRRGRSEIAVLLCDDAAIARLNARWRGHDRPTNVLSFPAPDRRQRTEDRGRNEPVRAGFKPARTRSSAFRRPLGDIAIAYETVAREAAAERKPVADHLAHLAIHGFLHLLGYDHENEREAERMELVERDILARIGIADPYAGDALDLCHG
jgi:probable rRNA maturation factor